MTMAHVSDVILCRAAKPYQIKNILHLGLGMMNPTKYFPSRLLFNISSCVHKVCPKSQVNNPNTI